MSKQATLSKYWKPRGQNNPAAARKLIADQTLEALDNDSYDLKGVKYALEVQATKKGTKYYAPQSLLSAWSSSPRALATNPPNHSLYEISTLDGARLLANSVAPGSKIGVLNFASAKKAGGGFLNGAQAQEESIARSSTLYPSLMTSTAQQFYTLHNNNAKSGFYTHAMIYSPNVRVFRDDAGEWVKPMTIDVLTSPAVNAGVVKKTLGEETDPQTLDDNIEKEMKERMGRILFLFEQQGAKHLVLGSFGTGVFQNSISMVATIWAELFNTRFRHSFETVVFAILGQATFTEFQQVFQTALSSDDTSEK